MALLLVACGQTDEAPYGSVTDADAPTVDSLAQIGFVNVDSFPVGCTLAEDPEAACDAIGAIFMDSREFDAGNIAINDEEYNRYEYVCPAIDGVEVSSWKCRTQEDAKG